MSDSIESINKFYKESFDNYVGTIVAYEREQVERVGNAYMDTYNTYITEQEEDEEYIEAIKKSLKA